MSKKVEILPMEFAAPFCSLTAPRYPKYSHCTASRAFSAGREMSQPYSFAISTSCFKKLICFSTSSMS